ncbi:MAG TPA: c-type cytochrome, partial [Dehalococcoidia bacterium]|nr:c-type cytochrome [Dehalococcoidia bacterium]
ILAFGGREVYLSWRHQEDARLAAIRLARAHADLLAAPPLPMLSVSEAAHGRDLFAGACVACHGPDARGVPGLGKDLVQSNFVAFQSDDQLRQFLINGRPDARPVAMPPRAGRDDLSDEDLRHIVVYLRGLQDPRRMPELPPPAATPAPSPAQNAAALAAAGNDPELAQYIASGDRIFHTVCIACHGRGGVGIPGNGKPLINNEFIRSLDDEALLAFIQQGRSPSDPRNTTGIQMPPKGGNPAMSEDDILDVIAYLRTLPGNTHAPTDRK